MKTFKDKIILTAFILSLVSGVEVGFNDRQECALRADDSLNGLVVLNQSGQLELQ